MREKLNCLILINFKLKKDKKQLFKSVKGLKFCIILYYPQLRQIAFRLTRSHLFLRQGSPAKHWCLLMKSKKSRFVETGPNGF